MVRDFLRTPLRCSSSPECSWRQVLTSSVLCIEAAPPRSSSTSSQTPGEFPGETLSDLSSESLSLAEVSG